MLTIFYISFVYTFCTYGTQYFLNILLLHFTEFVYSVSEPWNKWKGVSTRQFPLSVYYFTYILLIFHS